MNVGESIRRIRKRLRLTQADLALKLQVKQSTVSQYEAGKTQPGFAPLYLLLARAEGADERQPILEALRDVLHLEKTPTEREVEAEIDFAVETLEKLTGKEIFSKAQSLEYRYVTAVTRIMKAGQEAEPLVTLIEKWEQFHGDPRVLQFFDDAASYVTLQTVNLGLEKPLVADAIRRSKKKDGRRRTATTSASKGDGMSASSSPGSSSKLKRRAPDQGGESS